MENLTNIALLSITFFTLYKYSKRIFSLRVIRINSKNNAISSHRSGKVSNYFDRLNHIQKM